MKAQLNLHYLTVNQINEQCNNENNQNNENNKNNEKSMDFMICNTQFKSTVVRLTFQNLLQN